MYEGDSIKRKFLDKIISNYNLGYKKNLSNFKKLSEERIQLLKENQDYTMYKKEFYWIKWKLSGL